MKFHLTHLIITVVLLASVLFGYGFWYAALSEKSASVAVLQEQITTKEETMNRIASAREALSEIIGDETTVQNYFIPEDGIVTFINTLEQKGRAQGAAVNILSVTKGDVKTQSTLVLSLTISGTFDAVMRTVGAIEYAPRAVVVSDLSVVQNEEDGWRADMKITVGSMSTLPKTP